MIVIKVGAFDIDGGQQLVEWWAWRAATKATFSSPAATAVWRAARTSPPPWSHGPRPPAGLPRLIHLHSPVWGGGFAEAEQIGGSARVIL